MIEGEHVVFQSLLGTLFTWFVTALGSAVVFLFPDMKVCLLFFFPHALYHFTIHCFIMLLCILIFNVILI